MKFDRSTPLELDRHSGAPTRQPWRSWVERAAKGGPLAVDLFCGAGGLSLGLERAGYTTILAVDHDKQAVRTHLANFPGLCLDLDLSDPDQVDNVLRLLDGVDIDLLAGGPPCQPFSRAGRSKIRDLVDKGFREPVDPRSELWRVFLRFAEALRPRAVLMENVPDMALGDDMRTVRFMADRLQGIGYETDMRIVEAWRFAVPQHRHRLLFVGLRDAVLKWPSETGVVTLKDAIGDLPKLADSTGARELSYASPQTPFQARARDGIDANYARIIHDHFTRPVRDDDLEAFSLMRAGAKYTDLPDRLKRYRDDIFDDKYNRLDWNGLSRSITAHIAKDGYWYIHPSEHRTLTVREAARIQTFPDRFRFSGGRSDAFRLIGNAVPPVLGEAIARAIRESIASSASTSMNSPTRLRSGIRRTLQRWYHAESRTPAWRKVGYAWEVLVGVMAGRQCEEFADRILVAFPKPESVNDRLVTHLAASTTKAREQRVLNLLPKVAAALCETGWAGENWVSAAALGPADRLWVESIGIGVKHIAIGAAAQRIAGRLMGFEGIEGVPGRMLFAQLVGHSPDAPIVTAALAALGGAVCVAKPKCHMCPLAELCITKQLTNKTAGE